MAANQPTLFDAPLAPAFAGPEYTPALDRERLTKQHERVLGVMLDGQWRTLGELCARLNKLYPGTIFPEPSISAQIRHLKKPAFGSYDVSKRRRGNVSSGLYEFHVSQPKG